MFKKLKINSNYSIDENGNIRNDKRGTLVSQWVSKQGKGYYCVSLYFGHKKQGNFGVHRLLAQAFIPNPNNYDEVNHIDGNTKNNALTNLEWCSHIYNNNYGTKIQRQTQNHNYPKLGQHPAARKVQCIELDIIYDCAKSASLALGIDNSDIGKACKGKLKTAGGYHWRYADD